MPTNCVWLDGLSSNVSDQYLTRHFCRYGPVVKVGGRFKVISGSLSWYFVFSVSISSADFFFSNSYIKILFSKVWCGRAFASLSL